MESANNRENEAQPQMEERESEVVQSCPTLCDPMHCSLPGSFIHGIFQARVLEWATISFCRGIFPTQGLNARSSALQEDALPSEPPGKLQMEEPIPKWKDPLMTWSWICLCLMLWPDFHFPVTWSIMSLIKGQIGASLVVQVVKCLPAMQETPVWSLGREDPLEKEMATHSSTLAWKIPWMQEPGRLLTIGSQRVGHNWATSLAS